MGPKPHPQEPFEGNGEAVRTGGSRANVWSVLDQFPPEQPVGHPTTALVSDREVAAVIQHLGAVASGIFERVGQYAVGVGSARAGDARTEDEDRVGQPLRIDGRQHERGTTGAARR